VHADAWQRLLLFLDYVSYFLDYALHARLLEESAFFFYYAHMAIKVDICPEDNIYSFK
jgi:hypothetical protein